MKKILFFASLGISLLIIIHLVQSIYTLWHKQDLVTQARQELVQEKKENKKLHQELSIVSTEEFVEEEARNKLLMIKPGEKEILIASNTPQPEKSRPQDTLPNWQQWLALFSL